MGPNAQSLQVETADYQAEYRVLSPTSIRMKRKLLQDIEKPDILPNMWAMLWGDTSENESYCRIGDGWFRLAGKIAVFLPPFSISMWKTKGGDVSFEAVISTGPLPAISPRVPAFYSLGDVAEFNSVEEVDHFLSVTPPLGYLDIENGAPGVIRRFRRELNLRYTEAVAISAIAKDLNAPHSSLTRGFSRTFGVSPIEYRNHLRIYDAWWKVIVGGHAVSDICHAVGFNDLSRFNKQFKRRIQATPREHRKTVRGRCL